MEIREENIIELRNVGCRIGENYLLDDISWKIKKGDHWVVFGMNGSGKTTLLSIIAGFMHYTTGDVKIYGKPLTNNNVLEMRKKIGWVSASFFDKVYSLESALNIVLSGKEGTLGLDSTVSLEDVKMAKALLRELKLGERIDWAFDMFSKGERQNILIARALINNPDVLILDEPCTGLDVYNRSYLFKNIEMLSKKKELTIIYVTHYVEEILPLFDKILLLKKGHVFTIGETKAVLNNETMSALVGYDSYISEEWNGGYQMQVSTESNLMELLDRRGGIV